MDVDDRNIGNLHISDRGMCTATASDNDLNLKQFCVPPTNTDDGDNFLRFIVNQQSISGRSPR